VGAANASCNKQISIPIFFEVKNRCFFAKCCGAAIHALSIVSPKIPFKNNDVYP
jgi:hypothetical protein